METWSDDELLTRWEKVTKEFKETLENATPLLMKLSKAEMEIQALKAEILKRGVSINDKEIR